MADLKNRYQQILSEIQEHIQDEEQKKFVISKFQELSIVFMDIIDRLTYITDVRVKEVETKQKEIESKIGEVQSAVNGIESDIYEDGESYEFEITCPYCNYEFIADINSDISTEVECPECHNVIELDWNEDDCGHECSGCSHDCKEEITYDDAENKEKPEEQENPNNDQEDM